MASDSEAEGLRFGLGNTGAIILQQHHHKRHQDRKLRTSEFGAKCCRNRYSGLQDSILRASGSEARSSRLGLLNTREIRLQQYHNVWIQDQKLRPSVTETKVFILAFKTVAPSFCSNTKPRGFRSEAECSHLTSGTPELLNTNQGAGGRHWTHLLSTLQMAPASWAMAAMAAISQMRMRGFVGDSTITTAVFPGITASFTFLRHARIEISMI